MQSNTKCYCLQHIYLLSESHLSKKAELRIQLGLDNNATDQQLISHAYLKWGLDFTTQLDGEFLIIIYDQKLQTVIAATDRKASYPCFYYKTPRSTLLVSNDFSWISQQCVHLTINTNMFNQFAIDNLPGNQTCYQEILKLPPGHLLISRNSKTSLQQYWQARDWATQLRYKKRHEYYEHFEALFSNVIKERTHGKNKIVSQLSGGLDSSAVTAITAHHLKPQVINTFTTQPRQLQIDSYRHGWKNHEIQLVHDLSKQYENLNTYFYQSEPTSDPLLQLSHYYDHIDQPIRNVMNYDWIIGCFEHSQQMNADLLLSGANGNGTISWAGYHPLSAIRLLARKQLKNLRKTTNNNTILTPWVQSQAYNQTQQFYNPQHELLLNPRGWMRQSAAKAIERYHNIELFDPTAADSIRAFCYNVPQWAYRRSRITTERRLLVREGLANYLPQSICLNNSRGEQAADWYLQYNNHINKWQQQLQTLSAETQNLIWNIYNKDYVFNLIKQYPHIEGPSATTTALIRCQLMRCFSAAFFLEHIINKPNVSYNPR